MVGLPETTARRLTGLVRGPAASPTRRLMSQTPPLGHFSVSLAVKDIAASRDFYAALGFTKLDGDGENWLILDRDGIKIGLFQGMFDQNILTFNPADARGIEAAMKAAGYEIAQETKGDEGPANFAMTDPDGNMLLFDQF